MSLGFLSVHLISSFDFHASFNLSLLTFCFFSPYGQSGQFFNFKRHKIDFSCAIGFDKYNNYL